MTSTIKTALVTGASKRLGKALAIKAAALGYHTWVNYLHSKSEALQVVKEIESAGGTASIVEGDVSKPEDVDHIIKTIQQASGQLDLLVNNVGIYETGSLLEFTADNFENIIVTNLFGSNRLIQAAIPLFTHEGGNIINIGFTGSHLSHASTHATAYVISKSALLTLSNSYANLLGPKNIRVNMISPGQLENSVDLPDNLTELIPIGRAGTVDDVANAFEFIISEKAGYITGQNLEIAGGYMSSLQSNLP
jgi:3-oxoacyl-[acyl-carrier protein] reductase